MDLHLDLADTPGGSLRARLEHALREALRSGRLPVESRLPSTRALCAQLGVSRGVVVDAYAQLVAEGYLRARRGGGTVVAAPVPGAAAPALDSAPAPAPRYDLSPFCPALDAFPRAAWASSLTRVLRSVPDERLAYADPAGAPELRRAVATYLGRARGVQADPEQVVVTGGTRPAFALAWSVLAKAGVARVAIESPGWDGVAETAEDAGLSCVAVAVDEHGMRVSRLPSARVQAVALAPAHQYPTGAVLSPERRSALVAWAREHDATILEDDYDAEYRYDRQPVGAVQGLAPERVLYAGSTSKTLAPALRLGWLVAPRSLVAALVERQRRLGSAPSMPHQLALAQLIERGELDRYLRRQRRLYARRRAALIEALARELPRARVMGAAAGLYVLVQLPAGASEEWVVQAARARGIALQGGGTEYPALVVGYANLPEPAVVAAVRELAVSVREAKRRDARQEA